MKPLLALRTVFMVCALICFIIAALKVPTKRFNYTAAGLVFYMLALLTP